MPKTENASIPAPAGTLEANILWQEGARAIALICHPHPLFGGTMDNKVVTTMARFAKSQGMHVVRFNFRGVGSSTGEHDHAVGEVDDAEAVLNWLGDHSHVKHIWLAGFSFGGFVAAKLAERMVEEPEFSHWKLQRLTLVAPAVASVNDTIYDVSSLVLPKDKTHVIYGDADEVIPPKAIEDFAKRYDLETSVLPEASHFFHRRLHDLTAQLRTE